MARRLAAKGVYYEQGDFVMGEIFMIDPDTQVYHPEEVASATCELQNSLRKALASITFDLYNGNADGSFKVFFFHPASVHDLYLHIDMILIDGTEYATTSSVSTESYDSALAENETDA